MFLVTVALIWTVAAVTPGPNVLVAIRCSINGSRRTAFASVAGTLCGTALWGLAGAFGITALFTAAPLAYAILKIVGGVYIAYLGARMIWKARRPGSLGETDLATKGPGWAFRLGFVTNIANPKSAAFVAGLFAAALPADPTWWHGLAAVAVMLTISATWYTILVLSLTHHRVASAYRAMRRRVDLVTGALFVGFGSALALAGR
ncbi:LysE family translocator [Acuticoccus sp. M5D2P5]|uniref:LysE family translocator n=1 Tax=Acuticoccus kalidii TaxID=2910977 RepID=UPI001F29786C|nr:LysE family translocator [Acuticoccus kalidii]MCF3931950.1 LysE family translocator [Acuticoccus kalidii]